jgi:methionine biosynthesis protein MetW
MRGEHGPLVHELFGRGDYGLISEIVEPGSRVLDLGCGEGELLAWLAEHKNIDARGVEIDATKIQKAIARGVSAYQGDIERCLADYPDDAFDYVLLSQTLQEVRYPLQVMQDIMRISARAIIAFPNFGHYRVRLSHLFTGRAPKTKLFPYDWYDSPNIHFLTVDDFEILVARQHWRIERRYFLSGTKEISAMPNLLAEVAVFVVTRT